MANKPYLDRLRDDRAFFFHEMFFNREEDGPMLLTNQQQEVCDYLSACEKDLGMSRWIAIKSGHGTGKTRLAAGLIIHYVMTRKGAQCPCTAGTGSQIQDILWKEIKILLEQMDKRKPQFRKMLDINSKRLTNLTMEGSFASARTSDKKKPDAMQGFHGPATLGVIDEGPGVPDEIFKAMEGVDTDIVPMIVLVLGNPTRRSGYFFDIFEAEEKGSRIWKCFTFNSEDSAIVNERYWQNMLEKYGDKDSDEYRMRVRGLFPKTDTSSLINPDRINDAVDKFKIGDEGYRQFPMAYALDVGMGGDKTILTKKRGCFVYDQESNNDDDAFKIADFVKSHHIVDRPMIIRIDTIGVGSGVYDVLRKYGFNCYPVRANHAPINPIAGFADFKTEMWFKLKDEFDAGTIAIPNDPELIRQLTLMRYKRTEGQKIKMLSKDEFKKEYGGKISPDKADSLVLHCASSMPVPVPKFAQESRSRPRGVNYGVYF